MLTIMLPQKIIQPIGMKFCIVIANALFHFPVVFHDHFLWTPNKNLRHRSSNPKNTVPYDLDLAGSCERALALAARGP